MTRVDRRCSGMASLVGEVEVLRALVTGASTVEVARELYVSPKTAKNHIAHIYAKLGVSSRTQAVARALRQGIVRLDSTSAHLGKTWDQLRPLTVRPKAEAPQLAAGVGRRDRQVVRPAGTSPFPDGIVPRAGRCPLALRTKQWPQQAFTLLWPWWPCSWMWLGQGTTFL